VPAAQGHHGVARGGLQGARVAGHERSRLDELEVTHAGLLRGRGVVPEGAVLAFPAAPRAPVRGQHERVCICTRHHRNAHAPVLRRGNVMRAFVALPLPMPA